MNFRHQLFPKNLRPKLYPHTNTVILPYIPTVLQALRVGYLWFCGVTGYCQDGGLIPRPKQLKRKTETNTKRRNKTRIYLNKFTEYFGLLTLEKGPGDHLPALVNFISSKQRLTRDGDKTHTTENVCMTSVTCVADVI